jgi:DNA polymerase-3 subunit alpha
MGISILPPDVNSSDHEFVVVEGNIRFGLDAVKGVGFAAVEAIKKAREEGGLFSSIYDFCARVDGRAVNKKAIEALIKCGAFGSTGASRKGMLAVLEQAQGAGQKAQQDALIGQGSIFDLGGGEPGLGASGGASPSLAPSHAPIPGGEFDRAELLAAEKESLGLFISAHPLKEVDAALRRRVDCSLPELATRRDGDWVTVGGMIVESKRIRTKKGDPMMFATLDDLNGSVELVIFGKALAASEEAVASDSVVLVRGRVDHKDRDRTCLVVQQMDRFEPSSEEVRDAIEHAALLAAPPPVLRLRLNPRLLPASTLSDLKDVLAAFPGEAEVVIELASSVGPRRLKLGSEFRVARGAALHAELHTLLGEAMVAAEAAVGGEGAGAEEAAAADRAALAASA